MASATQSRNSRTVTSSWFSTEHGSCAHTGIEYLGFIGSNLGTAKRIVLHRVMSLLTGYLQVQGPIVNLDIVGIKSVIMGNLYRPVDRVALSILNREITLVKALWQDVSGELENGSMIKTPHSGNNPCVSNLLNIFRLLPPIHCWFIHCLDFSICLWRPGVSAPPVSACLHVFGLIRDGF